MTAAHEPGIGFPAHRWLPADPDGRREFYAEQLIQRHADEQRPWFITALRDLIRPDLTAAQVDEAVDELCRLNGEVQQQELEGNQRGMEHALDDYAAELFRFAAKPDDLVALVLAVQGPADELAAKRGER
jgi:hypothetical protein